MSDRKRPRPTPRVRKKTRKAMDEHESQFPEHDTADDSPIAAGGCASDSKSDAND